jgi:hypothetical protein
MHNRSLLAAAAAAFLVAPFTLAAQEKPPTVITVCKDSTTTTHTGKYRCSEHHGVDHNATQMKNAKTGVDKTAAATDIAAENTGKTVKKAAGQTSDAVSKGAEDVGKAAKGTAAEVAGDNTNSVSTDATAKCKDASYSHATQSQGACAQHGGVEFWMKKPPTD